MKENETYYKNVKHLRAFLIKYLGATNTLSARMVIKDSRHKKRIVLDRDDNYSFGRSQVYDYLKGMGINCCYSTELSEDTDLILTDDFETQLKKV